MYNNNNNERNNTIATRFFSVSFDVTETDGLTVEREIRKLYGVLTVNEIDPSNVKNTWWTCKKCYTSTNLKRRKTCWRCGTKRTV